MSMENYFSVDYWGLYPNSDINDVGLALNEQGVSGKFTSGQMGDAVRSIEKGSSASVTGEMLVLGNGSVSGEELNL